MSRHCLINLHSGYGENGKTSVLTPATGKQIHVYQLKAENRSGGAVDVGILKKLATANWKMFSITVASTPDAADVTSTIQAGSAQPLFTTTNNDGFLVQSASKFNLIGLNVSVAASGGAPAYAYTYYNGTSMATLSTIAVPASYGSGTQLILFNAPVDWALGTTAAVGGDSDKYAIQVVASTASGTTGGSANSLWVGQFFDFQASVADKANLDIPIYQNEPLMLNANEGVFPYFSGTASAQNAIRILYKIQD
jgi:hypothetical protein